MATAQPGDQFLVNRNGQSYYVNQENLMANLQDDDLMLVNRDDPSTGEQKSYKITGAEVKESIVDPVTFTVTLSTQDPVVGEDITAIVDISGGKDNVTTYQWQRDGVDIVAEVSYSQRELTKTASNPNAATYRVQEDDLRAVLDCEVTVTPSVGDAVTVTSPETNAVIAGETVVAPDLVSPPNGAGLDSGSGQNTQIPITSAITGVANEGGTKTTLTFADDTDLGIMEPGDATMTDENGNVLSYTPKTSYIKNIINRSPVGPLISDSDWNSTYEKTGDRADFTSLLQAQGVTHITGFFNFTSPYTDPTDNRVKPLYSYTGCFGNGAQGGSNASSVNMKINGEFVDTLGLKITSQYGLGVLGFETGKFTWPAMIDGTTIITQGIVGTENTYSFTTATYACMVTQSDGSMLPMTSFESSGFVYSKPDKLGFGIFDQNGRLVVLVGSDYPVTLPTLTFEAPNPDLQYFLPGDNIQDVGEIYSDKFSVPNPQQGFAFDGNTSTIFAWTANNVPANTYVTWTPKTPVSYGSTVEVYITSVSGASVKLNDGNPIALTAGGWTTIAYGAGKINKLAITRDVEQVHSWSAIRVDGIVLKDDGYPVEVLSTNLTAGTMNVSGGDWSTQGGTPDNADYLQTMVWSQYYYDTDGNGFAAGYDKSRAFDGALSSDGGSGAAAPTIYSPPNEIIVNKLEISVYNETVVTFPDGSTAIAAGTGSSPSYSEVTIPGNGSFVLGGSNSLQFNTSDGTGYQYLNAIKVNDLILVDSTGATKVTGETATGTGKIAAGDIDVANKQITVTDSNQRWIGSNSNSTSFHLAGDEVSGITVNPDDVHMIIDPDQVFGAPPSTGDPVYGSTLWQIAEDTDENAEDEVIFANPVINVRNTSQKVYDVATSVPKTSIVTGVTGSGPYTLKFADSTNLNRFEENENVTSIGSAFDFTGGLYGLRFDADRKTSMQRIFDIFPATNTLSVWIKPTSPTSWNNIFGGGGSGTDYFATIGTDVLVGVGVSDQNPYLTFADCVTLNEWQNLVITKSGTSVTVYVNGVDKGTQTTNGTYGSNDVWRVGQQGTSDVSSSSSWSNGYFSAFYFVDGQALPPSTFGTTNSDTQTWVPLPPAETKTAITDAGGFGANGFYLPFNPDAVGVNYSAGADWIPYNNQSIYSAASAFDGDTQSSNAQSTEETATINFSGMGTGTVGLVLSGSIVDDSTIYYEINGVRLLTSNTTETAIGGNKLITYNTPVALSTITQVNGSAGSSGSLYGVYFNNELLVDHNNIGVDDSGNNNDFHDVNFAVGNTSRIWSEACGLSLEPTVNIIDSSLAGIFSGSLTEYLYVKSDSITEAGTLCTITFPPNVKASTVSVYTGGDSGATYSVNGGTAVYENGAYNWTTIYRGVQVDINTLEIGFSSGSADNIISGIELDGVQLVDANVQDTVIDTPVTDYCVVVGAADGALDATFVTGNLAGYGSIFESEYGGKFYAEFTCVTAQNGGSTADYGIGISSATNSDTTALYYISGAGDIFYKSTSSSENAGFTYGVGDVIGVVWDNTFNTGSLTYYKNGVEVYTLSNVYSSTWYVLVSSQSACDFIANYGQQPFVYATNNMDGTVTLPASYNTSQNWSTAVSGTSEGSLDSSAFDGNLSTYTGVSCGSQYGNGTSGNPCVFTIDFEGAGIPINYSSEVRIYIGNYYVTPTSYSFNDGAFVSPPVMAEDDLNNGKWYTIASGSGVFNKLILSSTTSLSGTSAPRLYAIMVDGSILVDSSIYNTSRKWNNSIVEYSQLGEQGPFENLNKDNLNYITNFSLKFDPPVPFTTLKYGCSNSTGGPAKINGSDTAVTVNNQPDATPITYVGSDTSLSTFTYGETNGTGLFWIEIDGALLVNTGGGTFSTLYQSTGTGSGGTTVTGTVASVDIPNLTMSVAATDDWSDTVGKTVEGEPGTGLKADTRYRARAQWRSQNDVDSPFSNTNTFKTAAGNPDPTPVGGAGGLRFDPDRNTYLQRSALEQQTFQQTFTTSFWVKLGKIVTANSYQFVFTYGLGGSFAIAAVNDQGGVWDLYNGDSHNYQSSGPTPVLNEWMHIVLVASPQSGSIIGNLYVNGQIAVPNCTLYYSAFDGFTIGSYIGDSTGAAGGYVPEGYMSEIYQVDGQVLAPTDFAQSIDNGTWAPLAPATISTNIANAGGYGSGGFYLPFNPDAVGNNYAQYGVAVPTINTVDGLFNGSNGPANISPTYSWGNGDGLREDYLTILDGVNIPANTFQFTMDIGTQYWKVRINGTDELDLGNASSIGTSGTLTSPLTVTSGTINKIEIMYSGNTSSLWAFYVDGEMLIDYNNIGVDASGNNNDFADQNFAVGNTSQVWSKTGTATNVSATQPVTNAFNGDFSADSYWGADNLTTSRFTFGEIVTGTKFEVAMSVSLLNTNFTVNGVLPAEVPNSTMSTLYSFFDVTDAVTASGLGGLSYIDISLSSGVYAQYVYGIRVDGELLIDANIQDTVLDRPVSNYAVIANTSTYNTTSNGNLTMSTDDGGTGTTSGAGGSQSFEISSNGTPNYYAECTIGSTECTPGVLPYGSTLYPGAANTNNNGNGVGWYGGTILVNGSVVQIVPAGQGLKVGDVVGIAVRGGTDVDFYKNGQFIKSIPTDSPGFGGGPWTFGFGGNGSLGTINYGQQPFAYATNNGNGTASLLESGGSGKVELYNLSVKDITAAQVGSGDLYYDENYGRVLSTLQMANKYGVPARADKKRGICALTEQPTYPVINYTKVGDLYQPNRDYLPEVQRLRRILLKAACAFQASHGIAVGDVIFEGGVFYEAVNAHTTGSTFDANDGNWRVITVDEDPATTY